MSSTDSSTKDLITCPKCYQAFTKTYIKENSHASHTGGLYCPNCYQLIDEKQLSQPKLKSQTSIQYLISEIIEAIDDYLIKTQKTYTSLGQANKLLIQNKVISVEERHNNRLKNILEDGYIPHAYQTNTKPKQWRIPISENGKEKSKKSVNHAQKRKNGIRHKETLREWYDGFSDREKKGFKRLTVFVAIVLIIVLTYIIPDNRSDLVKSLDKKYIGREWTDYTYQQFNNLYGPGQTLGFEDYRWVYYYPKGNFTIKVSKDNNRILQISDGKD